MVVVLDQVVGSPVAFGLLLGTALPVMPADTVGCLGLPGCTRKTSWLSVFNLLPSSLLQRPFAGFFVFLEVLSTHLVQLLGQIRMLCAQAILAKSNK